MSSNALILLAALLVVSAGCAASPTDAEVASATLFFPPHYRRIDEPRFCFSEAERQRALQEYRKQGADTLFELVIDARGAVKDVRLVRTHVDRHYHQDMLDHARWFAFSPDAADTAGTGYRAFFYPVKYRYDPSFEWIGPG